jgi:hypothetical protein
MVTSNHDLVSDDSSHISCLLSTGHIQHLNPRYATARKPDRALRLYPVTGWRPVLGELLSLSKSIAGTSTAALRRRRPSTRPNSRYACLHLSRSLPRGVGP